MAVHVVVIDYKCLQVHAPQLSGDLATLIGWIQSQGIQLCIFSTDPIDPVAYTQQLGLPTIADSISKADVPGGKNRGSPAWIEAVEAKYERPPHEYLYVGCTAMDWRTAINSGVAYLHARWASQLPAGVTTLVADAPRDVAVFMSHFLLPAPRWSFGRDDDVQGWSLRSLLPAGATLPRDSSHRNFRLQDVFTYEQEVMVGDTKARNLLLLHAISSCYVEGILGRNTFFCVYPSSNVGAVSQQISEYVKPAAAFVHGFYRDDLLVREVNAVDTSLARVRARQQGVSANVSILNQASTVKIGDKYRGKLSGRRVVVFDDFTTTGASLEWARILLQAAGVAEVVLVTMGKYGYRYVFHRPIADLDPYVLHPELQLDDFSLSNIPLEVNSSNEAVVQQLFRQWLVDEGESAS